MAWKGLSNRKYTVLQVNFSQFLSSLEYLILDSIVVSIPACHVGDRGSIPRRGDLFSLKNMYIDILAQL